MPTEHEPGYMVRRVIWSIPLVVLPIMFVLDAIVGAGFGWWTVLCAAFAGWNWCMLTIKQPKPKPQPPRYAERAAIARVRALQSFIVDHGLGGELAAFTEQLDRIDTKIKKGQ